MEILFCTAAACGNPAAYVRVLQTTVPLEERLCSCCYRVLKVYSPSLCRCYAPTPLKAVFMLFPSLEIEWRRSDPPSLFLAFAGA